ncbi:MAG: LytTR family transcriptional regulator [Rhodobacteraceae bacterium]|nr:LytTR family transcriptional regulator [Paracoccaceae bacterium]
MPRKIQSIALRNLESIYAETIAANGFSVLNAYKASWYYLLYLKLSAEYVFVTGGIFAVLASYGALSITVADFGITSIIFWLAMAPVSIIVSAIINVNLLPLHFLRGWNIWLLTGIAILVFSLSISFLGRMIWVYSGGVSETAFLRIFIFVFGLYFLARVFLLLLNESKLCFFEFKNRWLARDLELSIPVLIRGKLISLMAQDQMVQITTDRGYYLLRESLTKAIERIQNTDGLKVHRSHWVAKHAMRKLDQKNGRNLVVLSNGQQIPVSEKKIADVKGFLSKI